MRSLLGDVQFALRLVRRSPGFYAVLLLVLAGGLAATTAMFSITEALLLRPLGYPDAERLTMVWRSDPVVHQGPTSVPNFLDWKARASSFETLAAVDYASFNLSSPGAPAEFVPGAHVSGDFFATFGLSPLRGRLLGPDDDRPDAPPVAVISASLWRRRFGGTSDVVGQTVTLSARPFTIVGVAPEGFQLSGPWSDETDVWAPLPTLSASPADYAKLLETGRGSSFLNVVGKRRAGVSLAQASAEMDRITDELAARYPESNSRHGARLESLRDALVGDARSSVWILFAAVGLVFAIVCSNVANLLLTRAQERRGEMAVRAALGASPGRLARQIVTETVVLFLVGSVLGWGLSHLLVDFFADGVLEAASSGARTIAIHVDGGALAFAVFACLDCGVVFGLVPALAVARVEPQTVLKETAARAGVGRVQRVVRGGLVVGQVALASALLVGSALAVRSFARAAATPVGFDAEGLVSARVALPDATYKDDATTSAFYRALVAKVAARPDVRGAALDSCLPLAGSNSNSSFSIEGAPAWPRGEEPLLERNQVTPGYFAAMGIPILRGRDVGDADGAGGRLVLLLSQSAATRFFPGQDPLGRRIQFGDGEDGKPAWREIVGVVGDVRRYGPARPAVDEAYVPMAQDASGSAALVVRTSAPAAFLDALPRLVAELDPNLAVFSRRSMAERVAGSLGAYRSLAVLLGAFALVALGLACLGVFGLVAYATGQRRREIGIRIALGSTRVGAAGLVMRDGLALLGLGLALGTLGGLAVGRVLSEHMPVDAFDPGAYAGIVLLLGLSGVSACLAPAWRAVRVPPASALRYE